MRRSRASHNLRPVLLSLPLFLSFLSLIALAGCDDNTVHSQDDARRAYLGLDPSVDKAIDLGFAGFNEASRANISAQSAPGARSGTLTITGQVDQGSSANKEMRLNVAMAGYSDVAHLSYDAGPGAGGSLDAGAGAAIPALDMSLKDIPSGTLTGTLVGTFLMSGDLGGRVDLNLSFTGDLQPSADGGAGAVARKPGTVHITGTATSQSGVYAVDVTR